MTDLLIKAWEYSRLHREYFSACNIFGDDFEEITFDLDKTNDRVRILVSDWGDPFDWVEVGYITSDYKVHFSYFDEIEDLGVWADMYDSALTVENLCFYAIRILENHFYLKYNYYYRYSSIFRRIFKDAIDKGRVRL